MPPRKKQISQPTGTSAWTMEMDPTNSLLTSLTGNVPHHSRATAQTNTVTHSLRALQPSMSNGCVSSITADHTTSQTFCPALPASVQFDNNLNVGHVFQPAVSLVPCDMTLSVSTKQLKVLVTGCVNSNCFGELNSLMMTCMDNLTTIQIQCAAWVRKYCNVSAVETNFNWWSETRGKIKRTLGNHRNNCIKAMRLRFRGTCHQRGVTNITSSTSPMLILQMANLARSMATKT